MLCSQNTLCLILQKREVPSLNDGKSKLQIKKKRERERENERMKEFNKDFSSRAH